MQRRTLLRGLAAAVAGAGAGCASNSREVPATAPAPPAEIGGPADAGGDGGAGGDGAGGELEFAVPERDFQQDENGDLVVVLTVANRGQAPRDAVMTVRVAAGDQTFEPVRHVSLEAGAEETFRIRVPVPFDALTGFDVEFEPGTPATPLPTLTRPGTAAPTDDPSDGTNTAAADPDTSTDATEMGDGAGSTATDGDE